MPGCAALFFLQLNTQPVGAVKSHLNTGKKTHQQQGKQEPYYGLPFHHAVKIEKKPHQTFPGGKAVVKFTIGRNISRGVSQAIFRAGAGSGNP